MDGNLSFQATPEEKTKIQEEWALLISNTTTRQMREILGLTQPETAQRYGIPIGTIRKWDRGSSNPVFSEGFKNILNDCMAIIASETLTQIRSK